MARIDPSVAVADAGPLIHLDELNCRDVLDFPAMMAPRVVWREALQHRPLLAVEHFRGLELIDAEPNLSPRLRVLAAAMNLHRGEIAALSILETMPTAILLTDDSAARLAANSMGFFVHGTIGLLVRAIRRGRRSRDDVLQHLRKIVARSTLHVSRRLLDRVIDAVQRES